MTTAPQPTSSLGSARAPSATTTLNYLRLTARTNPPLPDSMLPSQTAPKLARSAVITTNRAHALVRVVAHLLPAVRPYTTQHANNRVETDHGRLKARLRPMRGLKRDRTANVVIRGHAFIQNLRRGHYELGMDARPGLTPAAPFDELALVV